MTSPKTFNKSLQIFSVLRKYETYYVSHAVNKFVQTIPTLSFLYVQIIYRSHLKGFLKSLFTFIEFRTLHILCERIYIIKKIMTIINDSYKHCIGLVYKILQRNVYNKSFQPMVFNKAMCVS